MTDNEDYIEGLLTDIMRNAMDLRDDLQAGSLDSEFWDEHLDDIRSIEADLSGVLDESEGAKGT